MFAELAKNTIVPLLLRLALAAVFIFHGLQLVSPEKQWGTAWMPGADSPPAAVQLAAAWGQLLGGVAMALGFLTRLAAAGLVIIMTGAIYLVHWPNGFDITKGGFEYNLVLIVICAALLFSGGGNLAVDRLVRMKRRRPGQ